MPILKTYDLFISHAWKYGESYDRLISLLGSANNFSFRNYSAPSDKPLHNLDSSDVHTKAQIKAAIDRKIKSVNAVLIISGMYYNYREWMQYELDSALKFGKPIIAIKPWGQILDVPLNIRIYSDDIVGWNTDSIISSIRNHAL